MSRATVTRISLSVVFSLALAAVLGFTIWPLVSQTINVLLETNPEVAAAIIATSGTIVAGVVAVIVSQQRSKSRDIAEAHRSTKVEVYSKFIKGTMNLVRTGTKKKLTVDQLRGNKELENFFFDVSTNFVLWASPTVFRAYENYRKAGLTASAEILLRVDDVFSAIRKDLGHSNRGLARGALMKVFLSDPESIDKLIKSSS